MFYCDETAGGCWLLTVTMLAYTSKFYVEGLAPQGHFTASGTSFASHHFVQGAL